MLVLGEAGLCIVFTFDAMLRPVTVTSLTMGFGLLAFSQLPANARLGVLIAVALVASALLTLLGLSAWLIAWTRRVG